MRGVQLAGNKEKGTDSEDDCCKESIPEGAGLAGFQSYSSVGTG